MPIEVKKLKEMHRTVEVPYAEGEVLSVTYRWAAINTKLGDWLAEHGGDRRSLVTWFEKVVTSWDITDNDAMVPITAAAIDELEIPTPLLRMIMDRVYEDAGSPKGKTLSSTL